ncbi:hypothetical protein [Vibrio parahaemolyticus]|uniref:hypothetical protein n=1 Tax=Vibrio parahaemolyticus TaxID=670 RepID=UPI0027E402F7|nr:hypothetical protein [Vibrio parahaemolyticus]WMN84111.1 hypothetical protein NI384_06320 [Vibrio parahaemolyticus]
MSAEQKLVYLESGKVSSASSKLLMFISFTLTLFLFLPNSEKITVPLMELELDYGLAVGVTLISHAFMWYRAIAAINYERLLRDMLKNELELSNLDVWRYAYPSIFNYHQLSPLFASGWRQRVMTIVSVISLFGMGIILPCAVIVIMLRHEVSMITVLCSALSASIYLLTFATQINVYRMEPQQKIKIITGSD